MMGIDLIVVLAIGLTAGFVVGILYAYARILLA